MARIFTQQPRTEALLELISNQLFLNNLVVRGQLEGESEALKTRMVDLINVIEHQRRELDLSQV